MSIQEKKNVKKSKRGNIYFKKMKNGEEHVMVRFTFEKEYLKNFTKLYGCINFTSARKKLEEIKVDISKGNNPFVVTKLTLNGVWEEFTELKLAEKDWKENTAVTYRNQYDRHVRKKIGWKKFSKVRRNDINSLFSDMSYLGNSSKSFVKLMLQDLFNFAIQKELIQKNVLKEFSFKRTKAENRKIVNIIVEEPLDAIRKIYNAIETFEPTMKKFQTDEVRASFYLFLMTAHRAEEILSLKEEHILLSENRFVSTPDITKTREYYHFPIPREVKTFIENTLTTRKELFPNMIRETLLKRWKELVKKADVKLLHNQTLTIHDTRRLMLSVMINDCHVDGMLADFCLNHKPSGVIKHYISFSYKNVEDAYEKFWKVMRGEADEITSDKMNLGTITLEDIPEAMIPMILAYKKEQQKIENELEVE